MADFGRRLAKSEKKEVKVFKIRSHVEILSKWL